MMQQEAQGSYKEYSSAYHNHHRNCLIFCVLSIVSSFFPNDISWPFFGVSEQFDPNFRVFLAWTIWIACVYSFSAFFVEWHGQAWNDKLGIDGLVNTINNKSFDFQNSINERIFAIDKFMNKSSPVFQSISLEDSTGSEINAVTYEYEMGFQNLKALYSQFRLGISDLRNELETVSEHLEEINKRFSKELGVVSFGPGLVLKDQISKAFDDHTPDEKSIDPYIFDNEKNQHF